MPSARPAPPTASPGDSSGALKGQLRSVQLNIAPQDARQILRVVGYLEYGRALEHFDKLLPLLTPAELKVVNTIVSERPELAVYVHLARKLPLARRSFLVERPRKAGDTYERRGLAWMMALARVELGAMLAGFTDVAAPFQTVKPSRFELPAFYELLLDGVRTHYWAILRDNKLKQVARQELPGPEKLAYIQRLTVARHFLKAFQQYAGSQLTAAQRAELQDWEAKLDARQGLLVATVQAFLEAQREETQYGAMCGKACGKLLKAFGNR